MEAALSGAIFVIQHKGGMMYSETPEEQGLSDGSRLLRIFASYGEAQRYRDALEEYAGDELVVTALSIDELWWPMKRLGDVKVELCQMPEAEWPIAIGTLWSPGQELH